MGWQKIMGETVFVPAVKERDCPVCGKHFVPAAQNIYKIRMRTGSKNKDYISKDVCSYTCFRKWQREKEEAKEKRRQQSAEKRRATLAAKQREKYAETKKKGADTDAAADGARVFATN